MDGITISLNPQELKALFLRLKKAENELSRIERGILFQLEKRIYRSLSVQEAETLMREVENSRCLDSSGL
jgi:hypothetical protein